MGVGFPDSFAPTTRDYALTAGLLTANPFNTGRQYHSDWDTWKQSVADRLTIGGLFEMAGTSAAFFGINRFLTPRIKRRVNQLGARGFLLPLFLSSAALSMVTSALMTTYQRFKYDQFAQGQSGIQQWATGLLYSIPASMLGMGGSQVFRNISHLLRFDIGTEVVQAVASAGIGSTLESTGLQQKRNLTTGQRIAQEFVEGVLYMGMGRFVGGVAGGFTLAAHPAEKPYGWVSGERLGREGCTALDRWLLTRWLGHECPPSEMGAPRLADPGLGLVGPAALSVVASGAAASAVRSVPAVEIEVVNGRPDLPAGAALDNPPWIDPAPWTRGTEAQQKWYPRRSDGLKQEVAGKIAAHRLRALMRERMRDGSRPRIMKLIDEMTARITDPEAVKIAGQETSGIRDRSEKKRVRERIVRERNLAAKRAAREQLMAALIGKGGREPRLIEATWKLINHLAGSIPEGRLQGRLKAELAELFLRRGVRSGSTIHTDVPYLCQALEIDVRRVRDGKYMDPKECAFFDPVIDGDTLQVWVPGMKDSISIRFACANTLEATHEYLGDKVLPPEWRCLRGEFGAHGGYKFLKTMMEKFNYKIYLRVYEIDDYGRPVCEVFVKKPRGFNKNDPLFRDLPFTLRNDNDPYINVNLALVESGWAHPYFLGGDTSGMINEFIAAQEIARAAERGIWKHPILAKEPLFVTSYHGYAHQMEPDWRPTGDDQKAPARKEYFRVTNTSREYVNLKGWQVKIGDDVITLTGTDFMLAPGFGVQVYSHFAPYPNMTQNMNPRAGLLINLDLDRKWADRRKRNDWHYWHERHPLELLAPDGHLVCQEAASAEAFKMLDPRVKALRGFTF